MGSLMFVVAVLTYVLFHSINGAQSNSFSFYLFCYSLAGFGVALWSGGVVDLVIHRGTNVDRLTVGKVSVGVIAGLALTFVSAPYPPYGVIGTDYTGFPLPFAATLYGATASPPTSVYYPMALIIDCIFWIVLSYPAVGIVGSVLTRDLKAMGLLEGAGAAAFLTYGLYPVWKGLISTGAFSSMFMAISPVGSFLLLFFLPGLLVGALLAAKGHKRLGFTVVSASLLFVSLFELAVLSALLQVVP